MILLYITNCTICGNEFEHKFPSVKVCFTCQNRPCEVCGKPFKHIEPYTQKCCSKECRHILLKDPSRNAELTAKRKQYNLEKYGVENVSQLPEVKDKIKLHKTNPGQYAKEQAKIKGENKAEPILRNCIICGKQFIAIGSQTTCSGPHYKTCIVCGKEFEFKHISQKTQTCSRKCSAALRKQNLKSTKRTCEYCGKEFYSESSTAKFCSGPHFKKCEVCGKEFEVNLEAGLSSLPKTCSNECKKKARISTSLAKYGVEYPAQQLEMKQHLRESAIDAEEQRRANSLAKWGVPYPVQSSEIRHKLSEKIKSAPVQAQIRKTTLDRYGVNYAMQSPEFAKKHSNSQFKATAMDGTSVDSSWEAIFYNFLLRNNIEFSYNTYSIPFTYNGKEHFTHIDFKVGDRLFEVKGSHLLQGAYADKLEVPMEVKLDIYRKHHVIIITDNSCRSFFGKPNSVESNGLKYLDKCPDPLIGVDISLFDNPTFPFADDRPQCFYKVRVDTNPSSLDAFFDESVRWKMILNRIDYTGGFIDNKQILTAMNVTRTCKQPSWFAKSLAKRIIKQYCTSNVIVDPFAGWGMRHDAAVELGKTYIGSDYNPELVTWHKAKGRSITFKDANDFTYDKQCSVFICPPYSDPSTGRCFEDYAFEGFDASAKMLSQCDWLKIVMKNVPNASEYVMVCKIVDPEFAQYVVEEIKNQSHFGTNSEYIIRVPNSNLE